MTSKFFVSFIFLILIIVSFIVFELMTNEKRDYINIAFNKRDKWKKFKKICRLLFLFLIIIFSSFSFFNYHSENKGTDQKKNDPFSLKSLFDFKKTESNEKDTPTSSDKGLLDGIEKNSGGNSLLEGITPNSEQVEK